MDRIRTVGDGNREQVKKKTKEEELDGIAWTVDASREQMKTKREEHRWNVYSLLWKREI